MFGNQREKALKKIRRELRAGLYSYLILSLLEREGELHGYAIRKKLGEMSGGKIVPSEGALYDILKGLGKLGLVQYEWAEVGGRPRKYYRLTDLGRDVLGELEDEVKGIVEVLKKMGGVE